MLTHTQARALPPSEQKRLARTLSPAALWERWGFGVIRAGNELRVMKDGSCLYRSVWTGDAWISGLSDAGNAIAKGVGDNISLFRHFEPKLGRLRHVDYGLALLTILTTCDDDYRPRAVASQAKKRGHPVLPPDSEAGRAAGIEYLAGRGISLPVIEAFEKAGVLRYTGETEKYAAGLVFIGLDPEGRIAFASRRRIDVPGTPVRSGDVSKRDLAGTDKSMIPVFPGSGKIVFTEGGVNMLSVVEAFARAGLPYPTVLMTGGQGNLAWKDNPRIMDILAKAGEVQVLAENDAHLSPEARERGEKLKEAQASAAERLSGLRPYIIRFPERYNDVNDVVAAGAGLHPDLESLVRVMAPEAFARDENGERPHA